MTARPLSPTVQHARFNATTTSSDPRLIILSLHVAGARRPLRALLDSGASNNFIRASCLSLLPSSIPVRKGAGDLIVKLADGKPQCVPRRVLSLPYTFDGFRSVDDFLVFEMNYAFDCILGIPWLARYRPQIDWLARSVKRRADYDVSAVFTHLLVAPSDWPHVRVVDQAATTYSTHSTGDGSLCSVCAVTINDAVEQRLPHTNNAVEQRLPHTTNAVEQRLPLTDNAVEQGLPHMTSAVEQRLPLTHDAVEQGLPHMTSAVEQRLPLTHDAVEQGLPHDRHRGRAVAPARYRHGIYDTTPRAGYRKLPPSAHGVSLRSRIRGRRAAYSPLRHGRESPS